MQGFFKRAQGFINYGSLWWGMIFLGAVLRLRQYLLNRSFWGDEASLAVNLVERNFGELTQVLDYHQAAPIGFLFIEKLSILLLGNHDYVLRLYPLFAGILAIYLIYRISRASFGTAGLFAVSMFSISWWLVHYSSELKQYGSDVMIALLMVFLAINCLKESAPARDYLLLGAVGAVVIWISHPSVFIMVGIGLALALEKLTRKTGPPWAWILGIGLLWLASFGLEYLVSLRHIVEDAYLVDYWRRTYAPLPPWSDLGWYRTTFYSFLFFAYHRADDLMAWVTLALTALGSLSLLVRDRKILLLLVSPFVVAGIASALHRYPLKDRFMLFLVPFAMLLMAEGVRAIYRLLAQWRTDFAALFTGILALSVVWQITPTTYEKALSGAREDIRPVLAYIAENRLPDDVIYVFHRTDLVFHYYAPFYGLDTGNILVGSQTPRKRVALQNFQDDVFSLVGNERVWFLFSEIVVCEDCPEEDSQTFYLNYIGQYGVIIDKFAGSGAIVYLYDLSP